MRSQRAARHRGRTDSAVDCSAPLGVPREDSRTQTRSQIRTAVESKRLPPLPPRAFFWKTWEQCCLLLTTGVTHGLQRSRALRPSFIRVCFPLRVCIRTLFFSEALGGPKKQGPNTDPGKKRLARKNKESVFPAADPCSSSRVLRDVRVPQHPQQGQSSPCGRRRRWFRGRGCCPPRLSCGRPAGT